MRNYMPDSDLTEQTNLAEREAGVTPSLSRRKLLASLGIAGATAVAAEVLGMRNVVFGKKDGVTDAVYDENGKLRLPDLLAMNFVLPVTAAQLRSETNPMPNWMYYVRDAGKEGYFYYDAADTASPDNTGTVLVSISGARFKRVVEDGVVNVQWFGATGNGVTDDAPAIQAALHAVPQAGGTLLFPPTESYYALKSQGIWIENRSHLSLTSSGAIIKYKDGVPDVRDTTRKYSNIVMQNCKHIKLEGLVLHGNISNRQALSGGESFQSCLTLISCENVLIRHCTFTEGMTDGIYVGGIYSGSPSTGTVSLSKNILIDFCAISRCRRNNISIVAADGVTVSNCSVTDAGTIQGTNPKCGIDVEPNKGWFGTCKRIRLQNNTIENSAGSYGVSFGGSGHEDVHVDGNRIAYNNTGLNF
ncbi:hypothetical protein FE783_17195 [Paenibacillus mesophilus]|uniref:right-handed parallel beta-helix repeat-containing protein n=1 Tax=Paenibacillus mesophilus TaxID=2582849 RepID=UPI00110F26C7|nr:right-handed parallel beta-helix repeat-containing protein [Paenibacillus mesophilus]TMV48780.1 hypothetical protein FE783_17195 [Paenibacillus mesophilus]